MLRAKDGSLAFSEDQVQPSAATAPNNRPEIGRRELRQIMIDSLLPGTIKWGHMLKAAERAPEGEEGYACSLTFERDESDGTKETVIVRPHQNTVAFRWEMEIVNVEKAHPTVAGFVRGGHMMGLGDSKAIITQHNAGDIVKVYAAYRAPETWLGEQDITTSGDPEAVRGRILKTFDGWSEQLLEIIRAVEPNFVVRPLMTLDPDLTWQRRVGSRFWDAAHVMTPFAGEGPTRRFWMRLTWEKSWKPPRSSSTVLLLLKIEHSGCYMSGGALASPRSSTEEKPSSADTYGARSPASTTRFGANSSQFDDEELEDVSEQDEEADQARIPTRATNPR
ncbi:SubName: Full=Related to monooxygenase-Streptomyces sp. Mg1 {ECO:0000313/EMBL:CCA67364.1} [Serendipita indica DSM 11827]|nr:SubName: Full=Related to monooxygenase-Streptomyces sp. Mg1 {ECO:0000313/EMBL:CCA67364.1} [Serendipita indica DSM 11827]